jgi:hypothetical protein
VAAHIIVGAKGATPVSKHNDALGSYRLQEILAWLSHLIFTADAKPASSEDLFKLLGEQLRCHVVAPRQGFGAMDSDLRGLEKLAHPALGWIGNTRSMKRRRTGRKAGMMRITAGT